MGKSMYKTSVKNMTIKTRVINSIALYLLLISVMSCDRPDCMNNNQTFDINQPSSKIYKEELVKELKIVDRSKLTYWLQKYEQVNDQEYLHFYIQGDNLCAKIVLRMNHWDRLKNLRKKKGVTYRGAEFTNLQFDIQQDSLRTEFIYSSFDRIID